MIEALYIGATGMQAQQTQVDAIANNLVNMATPGFKKARASFVDLMVRESALQRSGGADEAAPAAAGILRMGSGVAISGLPRLFEAGELKKTDAPRDLAIQGEGFLEVEMPDGTRAFTRGGSLGINKDGLLATAAGHPLKPGIAVPEGQQEWSIQSDGRVLARGSRSAAPMELGQLELVRFSNPSGLSVAGEDLYRATEVSGDAVGGRPGEEGIGSLAQGFLKGSNVRMVDEMVSLMLAQRAYEASVKIVQASDEMLGMVNGLRK